MSTHKQKVQAAQDEQIPYRPPQKLLVPCPDCGCVVLRGLAMPGGKIQRLDPVQFPVTGEPHDCEQALALALAVQGFRWNTVRIVAQQCTDEPGAIQFPLASTARRVEHESGVERPGEASDATEPFCP